MNIHTDNDAAGRYLYIEGGFMEESFEERMIASIKLGNILVPTAVFKNGTRFLEYDITGLADFKTWISKRSLAAAEMISLITQIDAAVSNVRNYLLSEDNLMIDMDCIYVDNTGNQLCFCAVPEFMCSFGRDLRKFTAEILTHININDSKALRIGFKLMQKITAEECRLHDMLEVFGEADSNERSEMSTSVCESSVNDKQGGSQNSISVGAADNMLNSTQSDILDSTADLSSAAFNWGADPAVNAPVYGAVNAPSWNDPAGVYSSAVSKSQLHSRAVQPDQRQPSFSSDSAMPYDRQAAGKASAKAAYPKNAGMDPTMDVSQTATGFDDNEDDEGTDSREQPGLRGALIGLLISQAVLAAAAVAVYMIKGSVTMHRLLPVYAVIAICLVLYHGISFVAGIKKG